MENKSNNALKQILIFGLIIVGIIVIHEIWNGTKITGYMEDCYKSKASNFDVNFRDCKAFGADMRRELLWLK